MMAMNLFYWWFLKAMVMCAASLRAEALAAFVFVYSFPMVRHRAPRQLSAMISLQRGRTISTARHACSLDEGAPGLDA